MEKPIPLVGTFLVAQRGYQYILQWLSKGTHAWTESSGIHSNLPIACLCSCCRNKHRCTDQAL